jgi:hypothetical protein
VLLGKGFSLLALFDKRLWGGYWQSPQNFGDTNALIRGQGNF